ncbi:MAG: serine--tRNA ligase [Gemmatimonadetes bacterium]|nr:serine--tRNA ligase [Gemmatimonadota bacterium]
MLDPALIRKEAAAVKAAIESKGDHANLDEWLALDGKRRTLLQEVEELKSVRNRVSEQIGVLKREKKSADEPIAEMKEVSQKIAAMDGDLRSIEDQIYEISIRIPNIPDESVPVGDESANRTEREWGRPAEHPFEAKTHWELGEALGILDFARSSKLSGSGFSLYWRDGAALQRALIRFMIDLHTKDHGYEEIYTPFLVSRESMFGTGQLPKMEEDMYQCRDDELFLIPTAEVPITNAHADEIFDDAELPRRYVGYTPCFRREAGSAGKETRGLNRMHQFDKVELVRFERTEDSYAALEELLGHAEEVLKRLELPYRVLTLATGDLSFAAAKTYDIEVWAPGQKRWLEVSSCSNFLDFQARRAKIRYRVADRKENRYVHTLNGSGLALPRLFIAVLETYQQADGSIAIPAALRPYLDGRRTLTGRDT